MEKSQKYKSTWNCQTIPKKLVKCCSALETFCSSWCSSTLYISTRHVNIAWILLLINRCEVGYCLLFCTREWELLVSACTCNGPPSPIAPPPFLFLPPLFLHCSVCSRQGSICSACHCWSSPRHAQTTRQHVEQHDSQLLPLASPSAPRADCDEEVEIRNSFLFFFLDKYLDILCVFFPNDLLRVFHTAVTSSAPVCCQIGPG